MLEIFYENTRDIYQNVANEKIKQRTDLYGNIQIFNLIIFLLWHLSYQQHLV